MNVSIQPREYGAFTDLERKGEFAFTFSGSSPKADPSETYGPHFRCEPDLKKRRSNTTGYCDQELERLLKKAETELDLEKRKTLFKLILQKLLMTCRFFMSDLLRIYRLSRPLQR